MSPEAFWRRLAQPLTRGHDHRTPCFLFSCEPVAAGLKILTSHFEGLPVTHWLSVKTLPLPALVSWWIAEGRPVEVVSEMELQLALRLGCPTERILVNGPAKHRWLARHPVPRLNVHFDSAEEIRLLGTLARGLQWRCGLRILTAEERDSDTPQLPTQFGISPSELPVAMALLKQRRLTVSTLHFHLGSHVPQADHICRAMNEVAGLALHHGLTPSVLDIGGGFPTSEVRGRGGRRLDAEFSMGKVADALRSVRKRCPSLREFWLENGRWLSARSGALLIRVLDIKERREHRHVICDGGRTMQALMSLWEHHSLLTIPNRSGPECATTVNGPTCMSFDQLTRRPLPSGSKRGDHLLWLDAGAYHLPWETRFSHGLCAVYWHDGKTTRCVREAETFERWFDHWV